MITQALGITLKSVIRNAAAAIHGANDIQNDAQAEVALAIIRRYGTLPEALIYFEPCTVNSSSRPADVLICHPEIGIVVIEVKGWLIDQIESINGGIFNVTKQGRIQPHSPLRQAEGAMFAIKHQLERTLSRQKSVLKTEFPLTNIMVAFPNITTAGWKRRGFDLAIAGEHAEHYLLRDDFASKERLSQRFFTLTARTLNESRKNRPLLPQHGVALKQVLGDSATLNEQRALRQENDEGTLGAYIDEIASLDKYLSAEQQSLSRMALMGNPRLVRGVAGSGKTVVLANVVARYIKRKTEVTRDMFDEQKNDIKIAVVCFNRSLVPMLQRKIRLAYRQQTQEDVPADILFVKHFNGFMWYVCNDLNTPLDYLKIDKKVGEVERAEQYLRQLDDFEATQPTWYESVLYDAIFVDEGQDLLPQEYQILHKLTKVDARTGERNLIVFYDDAQNMYARPRPNWSEIGIDLTSRSRVMKECFRNTRQIVDVAFNVLLGTYAPDDMRVQTRTYADVDTLIRNELVTETDTGFHIHFAEREFERPIVSAFETRSAEKLWIVEELRRLIEDEDVRPDDILILFNHERDYEDLDREIERYLKKHHVQGFVKPYGRHDDDKNSLIFRENYLTLSTVHGAKGYDAYIVFMVGVDQYAPDDREDRAAFYVGATRAKLILYISGIKSANSLLPEAEQACAATHLG